MSVTKRQRQTDRSSRQNLELCRSSNINREKERDTWGGEKRERNKEIKQNTTIKKKRGIERGRFRER